MCCVDETTIIASSHAMFLAESDDGHMMPYYVELFRANSVWKRLSEAVIAF